VSQKEERWAQEAYTNQGASERQGAHMCSDNGGSRKHVVASLIGAIVRMTEMERFIAW
jgi:hypothetical protein